MILLSENIMRLGKINGERKPSDEAGGQEQEMQAIRLL